MKDLIAICKKLSKRQVLAVMFLSGVTVLSGCATLRPEPVTVGQVVQMSKEGVPAEAIVQKMRDSETVYRFTAAQLVKLHDQGIADQVLNYMQQSDIEEERREQSSDDWEWDMWEPGVW